MILTGMLKVWFSMKSNYLRKILIVLICLLLLGIIAFAVLSLRSEHEKTTIGYIMTGSIGEPGWNGINYNGIKKVCDELGIELIVKENVLENTETNDCLNAVSELSDSGCEMIILSSYGYPTEVKEAIDKYPDISFYGISADYYSDNMTSYFGRMYQARYLSGLIAGMTTENDKIGYVAAMPNDEVIRGINAFTLGVRRVNPDAEVYVRWSGSWDDKTSETAAAEYLISETDIDFITCHQNQPYVIDAAENAGIYSIGYNEAYEGYSDKYLTSAVWNWEHLYNIIITDFMQGKANKKEHIWADISTGAVSLSEYSPLVGQNVIDEVEKAKNEIISGDDVFSGEIYDNNGNLICKKNEFISDSSLMNDMDWYVDGVIICE